MLLTTKQMQYMKPVGDDQFELNVKTVDATVLKKAVDENEDWHEVFGCDLYSNIEEIKQALRDAENGVPYD